MNPIQYLQNILSKGMNNPQQIIMNMIGKSNPMINNLMKMAQEGNHQGVEQFAQNLFKEKGRDFNSEFNEFMQNVRGQNR